MTAEHAALAAAVQRLAVLAAAGVAPVSAWRHAAEDAADPRVREVAGAVTTAHELPEVLAGVARSTESGSAWRVLAAAWTVAVEAGAPLAPVLDRTAAVLRDLAQSAREVEVALAGPRATSRVVLALPMLAIAMGALLGFDLAGAFASPAGAACLALGVALVVAAVRWNRRLLRWARETDATPGTPPELMAIALAGGFSIERAAAVVGTACERAGIGADPGELDAVLAFAGRAGVPAIALLRAEAEERRRAARAAAAERAVRLETRLLLPLGLCVLPAFVLLGVMPIALAILSATAAAL